MNIQLFSRVKIVYHVVTDMKSIFREACPDNQKPVYILNDKVSQEAMRCLGDKRRKQCQWDHDFCGRAQYNCLFVFIICKAPIPEPQQNELRIQVKAAGLSYVDNKVIRGRSRISLEG